MENFDSKDQERISASTSDNGKILLSHNLTRPELKTYISPKERIKTKTLVCLSAVLHKTVPETLAVTIAITRTTRITIFYYY